MDVLKGIIITVIVLAHLLLVNETGGAEGGGGKATFGSFPIILQSMYLGLMGYLILSGYFYRPRGFKTNMAKRLKQILVAVALASIILSLILWVYLNVLGYDLPIMDYVASVLTTFGLNYTGMSGMLTNVNNGSYFLVGMLWGFLIFYALADRILDDWRKIILIIILLLILQIVVVDYLTMKLPFLIKFGPIDAAFMFAGAGLAKLKFLENMEYGDKRRLMYWILPIVCFIVGVGLCYLSPPGIGYQSLRFGPYGSISIFPYFIESMLMFVPIAYIGFIFSKIPLVSSLFNSLGKHTMGLILLHVAVGKILVTAFGYQLRPSVIVPNAVQFPTDLVIAILTMAICLVICILIPVVLAKLKGMMGSKTVE